MRLINISTELVRFVSNPKPYLFLTGNPKENSFGVFIFDALHGVVVNKSKAMIRKVEAIKPGPKPKKENGDLDRRRRVTPEKKEQYPPLKPHKHKPKD